MTIKEIINFGYLRQITPWSNSPHKIPSRGISLREIPPRRIRFPQIPPWIISPHEIPPRKIPEIEDGSVNNECHCKIPVITEIQLSFSQLNSHSVLETLAILETSSAFCSCCQQPTNRKNAFHIFLRC